MRLQKIMIENFRSYKEKTEINFSDLTALVGKNDIGKSTVMEALDIFFHDGKEIIKLEKGDINVENSKNNINDIKITVVFSDLPNKVVLDGTYETTLKDEFLLNENNQLEICKTFKNASNTASSIKIEINACHPTNPNCHNLLQMKNTDLKKIVEKLNLDCDKSINSSMRCAIWNHYKDELCLSKTLIDVSSKDGDIKSIWTKMQSYLPTFSLFQSDRKNNDTDDEVQDPLKEAVKAIFAAPDLKEKLESIATQVKEEIQKITDLTLSKLKEVSSELSSSLHPNIPDIEALKWYDVFKNLSIFSDEDIPINKRGSGVRRLILLSFFRAEAEKRQKETGNQSIIYAIEEPETSQHKEHQLMLINALKQLADSENTQVIVTTHSSEMVKKLNPASLRLILKEKNTKKTEIKQFEQNCLPYPSLNEANYKAYGDISEEFHNELYGYLQSKAMDEDQDNFHEKSFDSWLKSKGCSDSKNWIRIKKDGDRQSGECTLQTFIRNFIHHPENKENRKYTHQELSSSIEEMVLIAKTL